MQIYSSLLIPVFIHNLHDHLWLTPMLLSQLCNHVLTLLLTSAYYTGNRTEGSPRHKHWPAGPAHFSDRRASTFYLSLARTGHLDICRATRFQIVLARTMTIHSMYFSRERPSHISAAFAQPFCYSKTPACRESESGMSIKHTDVSV